MKRSLIGRNILVTAGPTWVMIDAVRHISNFSTGRTGLTIAREAARRGARVTLLLGPGRALPSEDDRRSMRILHIVTFDDLHEQVRLHAGSRSYDAVIHTAAVSDYRPVSEESGKLSSAPEERILRLRRTPKIIDEIRALDPDTLLVKFKLEVGQAEPELIRAAEESRARSDADLIVANDRAEMRPRRHPAYLLDRGGVVGRTRTTAGLAERLISEIETRLEHRAFRAQPGMACPAPQSGSDEECG